MSFLSVLPPRNSTAIERAIEQTISGAVDVIDPGKIRDFWNPDRIPVEYISVLAHALSVDLWDDDWPEEKKREVLRKWPSLAFLKGTYPGFDGIIDLAGGQLVQVVTAPQRIFAVPGLSKDEFEGWLRRHPKVRITFAQGTEPVVARRGTYAGHTFADWDFNTIDIAPALMGRRAYLVENGQQSPLQLYSIDSQAVQNRGLVRERVIRPGRNLNGVFAQHNFAGLSFVNGFVVPRVYSYMLDRSYNSIRSNLHLTSVPVGYDPIDLKYRRESETGIDRFGTYAGRSFAGKHFKTRDISGDLLADVIYLHDPTIASPKMDGISFAGRSRVGIQPFAAEILVNLNERAKRGREFAGAGYVGRNFTAPDDDKKRRLLTRAARIAKGGRGNRDKILISYQLRRERTFADGLPADGSFKFGDQIRNRL